MPPDYWKIGKKQHFICSNLTLFIVPFLLSFFSFFSLYSFFFLFFFFLGRRRPSSPLQMTPLLLNRYETTTWISDRPKTNLHLSPTWNKFHSNDPVQWNCTNVAPDNTQKKTNFYIIKFSKIEQISYTYIVPDIKNCHERLKARYNGNCKLFRSFFLICTDSTLYMITGWLCPHFCHFQFWQKIHWTNKNNEKNDIWVQIQFQIWGLIFSIICI